MFERFLSGGERGNQPTGDTEQVDIILLTNRLFTFFVLLFFV